MPNILRFTQILIDFILILASFTLAYFLRVGWIFSTDFPFDIYLEAAAITSILWMGVLIFQRHYHPAPVSKRRMIINLALSNLVGITAFVLVFFYRKDVYFSRKILVYGWVISNILLISNALLFRIIKKHIYKKGIGTKKVLIVGANKTAEKAIENFQKHEPYYQPIAILDAYGAKKKEISGVPVLGKMNSLEEVLKEKNIDVIVQADCIEQTLNLANIAQEKKLEYFLMPSLLGEYREDASASLIGKKKFITFR